MDNSRFKFRAWDTTLFKMFEPRTLRDIAKEAPNNGVNWYQLKMMQYTGLCDKNGKEIYEGDILQTDSRVYRVEFYNYQWVFRRDENSHQALNQSTMYGYNFEVIGNIYEHAHLLTEAS